MSSARWEAPNLEGRLPIQLSAVGLPVLDLDTSALLLDLDAFDRNVRTMANHFQTRGVQWRPHAKAFKVPGDRTRLAADGGHWRNRHQSQRGRGDGGRRDRRYPDRPSRRRPEQGRTAGRALVPS